MRKTSINRTRSKGLSLIELLVAMTLGLTLSAGVVQIYVGSNATDRDREARQRMQENGRFSMNFLLREIRMAGYLGCTSDIDPADINVTLAGSAPASFQPLTGIQGWEAGGTDRGTVNNSATDVAVVSSTSAEWTTSSGSAISDFNAVPNSDIVRLWTASETPGTIDSINPGASPVVKVVPFDVEEDDFVLLSDCESADIVQVCQKSQGGGGSGFENLILNSSCTPGNVNPVNLTTGSGGQAVKLQGTLFYVGKRGDTDTNSPALFRRELASDGAAGTAEELLEGVESMQLLYGVNLDDDVRNTVDTYLPADLVPDWGNVISVRVSLLMQSVEDGTVPSPQAYVFDGVTYDGGGGGNGSLPTDNRVRRVFSSTITLRNRALGS